MIKALAYARVFGWGLALAGALAGCAGPAARDGASNRAGFYGGLTAGGGS